MSIALVVRSPRNIELVERAAPEPGEDEVLVRPTAVGLCGTDLEIVDGKIDADFVRYPVVLGHEWSGTVVADRSARFAAGVRVVAEGIVPCGSCARCEAGETNLCETYSEIGFTRDGAASTDLVVPRALLHPLAEDVSYEDGALAEPAAVVHRALARCAPAPGTRALVIGDGTIALLATVLLALRSAGEVVVLGRRGSQATLVASAGASRFETDARAVGTGYDLVVEAAGAASAASDAIGAVRRGGKVVLLGLPPHGETVSVAVDDLVNADVTILGSFGYDSAAFREIVDLLNDGSLRPSALVTHRYPLEGWAAAIEALRHARGARGKVMLEIGHAS